MAYVVDLGLIDGKRDRQAFKTTEEAGTFAEQARIKKQNEGLAAFNLPNEIRADALRASEILKPHGFSIYQATLEFAKARQALHSEGLDLQRVVAEYVKAFGLLKEHSVSIVDAATHYQAHVANYKKAPIIGKIVEKMLAGAEANERRDRTVGDLRNRLEKFAKGKRPQQKDETKEQFEARPTFGERKLIDIELDELKQWIQGHGWAAQTKINFLTKISQLFNYAIKHGWIEANLIERIDRPDAQDGEPQIFTVEQAKKLLGESINFGLRLYIAIGLFAGLRSAELLRLKGDAIKIEDKVIIVGADVAKKRSRRVVEMSDALLAWLEPVLPIKGPVVEASKFRDNMDALKRACGIEEWPHNALRHSFGSYHLAYHGDQVKTAAQMGHRDSTVVHNHYKALVLKSEAEKYWLLRQDN